MVMTNPFPCSMKPKLSPLPLFGERTIVIVDGNALPDIINNRTGHSHRRFIFTPSVKPVAAIVGRYVMTSVQPGQYHRSAIPAFHACRSSRPGYPRLFGFAHGRLHAGS